MDATAGHLEEDDRSREPVLRDILIAGDVHAVAYPTHACVRRNALPGSVYDHHAGVARQRMQNTGWERDGITRYRGVLRALRADLLRFGPSER